MSGKLSLIDQVRAVPEIAVRIWAGSENVRENGNYVVGLDGERHVIPLEVFEMANGIAQALQVRERKVETLTDVLNLRHDAEDLYLESIFGEKGIKILFVPAGVSGGSFYRSRLPGEFLTQGGFDVMAHHTECLDLAKALKYDVLLIQLAAIPVVYDIAKTAQENGVKIVYDIDDRWDAIPEENPAGTMFRDEMKANIEKIIKLADLVTVSTDPLKSYVLEKGAKRALTIPNKVPTPVLPVRDLGDPDIFRILWAGSPTHKLDLEVVAPALRNVLERGKGKVRFSCFGENIPEALEPVRSYVDTVRFVDFADYAELLAKIGADLAIAPLADNEFNRCKSAVKYLEYSSAGYPGLYSPVGEYQALVDLGAPISTVEDSKWEHELDNYINDYSKQWMKDRGREAQNWVKKNRCLMESKGVEWLKAAESVVEVKK